tara:strand:- start:96 stop:536 length:441 start_codon:yes stop_codon:yes gene_type:complete
MEFIVDTREQKPYTNHFKKLKHKYEVKKLNIGDYSIKGYEHKFAIERKEKNDFISSITRGRNRFRRELEKARDYDFFAVVVECDLFDIINGNYQSNAHPSSILSTLFMWQVRYSIPINLVGTRFGGALAIVKFSEAYLKYKAYEYE